MWAMLQANWPKLNAYQQGQLQGQLAARCPTPQAQQPAQSGWSGGSTPAYGGTASGGGGKKSMSEMRREFNSRQACFNMMNNMSMQNHATMLNTIENFGGTGNYWKVTDY